MIFQYQSINRIVISSLLLVLGLTVSTNPLAHNVVSGVYADGMTIEGEIGFSNGVMAEAGVVVQVLNEAGDKLGETVLTDDGAFVYQAETVQKHLFKANLSSGHIAEMVIEADELSGDAVAESNNVEAKGEISEKTAPQNNVAIASAISASELQSMIRSAVAQQVRPLQKELRAYKEKVMFRDIAGGLGFIFGLFGVAAWMASKRNVKDD
ncbi:hypothetical protein [Leucothrix pacifica]|uniref:Cobalt ABC transporter permease n=1 Tax=Leucothrix pacifica TaxID=1247513 RepID=A0A317C2U0_9GAMM|nr:hypothetical protein [Leucothrix pacifica]PWQ92639.1 hypothetical protein DKW60_20090 [Leucothrix pacifica]